MIKFPEIPGLQPESVLSVSNSTELNLPVKENKLRSVLSVMEKELQVTFTLAEVVFVDEEEIVHLNQKHLGRNYVTDIITFRYDDTEDNSAIEGTLYCCAPRILEQSAELSTTAEQEFYRICIHGLLHLCGHQDQSPKEKDDMTRLENHFLELCNL